VFFLRWPDPPHPGLHSPEVMTEDEPCPMCGPPDDGACQNCDDTGTVPGRSFVAWHTLGATIPEGWDYMVDGGTFVNASGVWSVVPEQPYLVREPLTPPDPPQDERRQWEGFHDYAPAEPVRVDPPEGAPAIDPAFLQGFLDVRDAIVAEVLRVLPLDGTDGD
jgi:hypothetical protein